MARSTFCLLSLIAASMWAAGAWAADDQLDTTSQTDITQSQVQSSTGSQPGTAGTESRTVITEKQPPKGGLQNEAVGIIPQAGIINFNNGISGTGSSDTRAIGGLMVDANLLNGIHMQNGKPFLGPSVGALYSHLGGMSSNLFGMNAVNESTNSHFVLIPLNVKAGYTFENSLRLAAHGGANVQYQSSATSVNVPALNASVGSNRSTWNTDPNLGADLEIGLGQSVAFLVRPDWTFASGMTIFTGTLGITFLIS